VTSLLAGVGLSGWPLAYKPAGYCGQLHQRYYHRQSSGLFTVGDVIQTEPYWHHRKTSTCASTAAQVTGERYTVPFQPQVFESAVINYTVTAPAARRRRRRTTRT
jgi:hypothetical protein